MSPGSLQAYNFPVLTDIASGWQHSRWGDSHIEKLVIIIQALGGLGLFLLGMIVMTDGLRGLAADRIRSALMRFTRTPVSGALTGTCCTALLQSSSATTVAIVGFVGAELMSFPNALGVVFGANIGTTVTGWMVALLGFKLKLSLLVLPLIFIGALMRLFAAQRIASSGLALAGFGLIFVGISQMQEGMAGLQTFISFEQLAGDTLIGRLQLLGLGLLFTLVTQSSSAGVASTLTALYAGMVNFDQAAALVIGMDIGTTVTTLFATIGGSLEARRTGVSHVIYNLLTGFGALLLITPYSQLWEWLAPGQLLANAEIGLVAFHTGFNVLGVLLALPFTAQFSRFIIRLLPASGSIYARLLDDALLPQTKLALNAVQRAIQLQLPLLLNHINAILGDHQHGLRTDLTALQTSLNETHHYLDRIHLSQPENPDWRRLVAMIHSLDHLQRLHERCEEEEDRAQSVSLSTLLQQQRQELISSNSEIVQHIQGGQWQQALARARATRQMIEHSAEQLRQTVIAEIGHGSIDVAKGTDSLEGIRWLRRVSHHCDRITYHLEQAVLLTGDQPPLNAQ